MRILLAFAAAAVVSACGGPNPFPPAGGGDGGGEAPTAEIPEALAGDLDNVIYDPVNNTLVVEGQSLDVPANVVYTRKPGLDVPGYQAYSAQDSSLGRHVTAYVQERDGTRGAIVVTGGQNQEYYRGSTFSRSGAYDPPTVEQKVLIEYAGNYVGLRNIPGDGGDLLPVTPGTNQAVLSTQAAEVTGSAFLRADFNDNQVSGTVYNRVSVDSGEALDNLALDGTAIDGSGAFAGTVSQGNQTKGDYGGIFGGPNASAVAGTLYAKDHIPGNDQEETGLFVLSQCGTPNADPLCNQPNP